jgi:hypothetical protein
MIAKQTSNRLIHSTSPYLLQHAHNPVDWFEWGQEALEKARREDKPILVSIGYSSCHWCHVMERESFEKDDIAQLMNQYYVCIKVDREERPDIDQIYMDAVQALGVHGGWPLNVFLTPDQKPFFGGTYFSPSSWVQVLTNIHNAFQGHRDQIEETAEELRTHLSHSNIERFTQPSLQTELLKDAEVIYETLSKGFDPAWGGMDKAPKFIMPSLWLWLLRYHHLTKNEKALEHVLLTLKRIAMGGIYDQVGGGFARYSVDGHWFAPHFEKMLYDNAQLMSLYSEAYAITRDNEFRTIVYETFDWLQREMTADQGGFYSALDADSEGVEGKYYVWKKNELDALLGPHAEMLTAYFGVKRGGNWEHGNNILIRQYPDEAFLKEYRLTASEWDEILKTGKRTLLRERNKRVKPGLDDKIITAWNAMMIIGLTDAYRAFGDIRFIKAALYNMRFLENELMEGTLLYRSYKERRSAVNGFLDDYAYLIQAFIRLYQVTFDEYWIHRAEAFMNHVVEQFYDAKEGYFHYTAAHAEQLIARRKEIFDNVIPASNSVMAQNLNQLGIILDHPEWKSLSEKMTMPLAHLIRSEPGYMSNWAINYTELKKGLAEVVFTGKDARALRQEFHQHFQPFALSMGTETASELPLLKDKPADREGTIYVCYNKTCLRPVHTVVEALVR